MKERDGISYTYQNEYQISGAHFGADFNVDPVTESMTKPNLGSSLSIQKIQLLVSILALLLIAYSVLSKQKGESK